MVAIRSDSSFDFFFRNNRIATMTTPVTVAILNTKTRNDGIKSPYLLSNSPAIALLIACRISSASVSPCPSAVQEQTNS